VIHRKLENVVHMKKKIDVKKKGGWAIRGTIIDVKKGGMGNQSTCGRGSEMFALQWVPNDLS
jgi:hypothetical protein